MNGLSLDGAGHPAQSEGAQAQPDVAQRDIEVVAGHDQVDRDREQPHTGDVCAELGPLCNDHQPNDHLDNAHRHHELMSVAAKHALRDGAQVLVPMREQVKELVSSSEERPEKEGKPQRPPSGIHGIAHLEDLQSSAVSEKTGKSDAMAGRVVGGIERLYLIDVAVS
jgi:hypothetical protein